MRPAPRSLLGKLSVEAISKPRWPRRSATEPASPALDVALKTFTATSPYATGKVSAGTHGTAITGYDGDSDTVVHSRSIGESMLPVHTAAAPSPRAARPASTPPKITACRSRLWRRRSLRLRAAIAAGSVVTGRNGSRSWTLGGRRSGSRTWPLEDQDAGVQERALLQRSPDGPVQPILEVHRPLELDHV